ncbi:MAG: acyl-CoA thioesterase [Cypionkella sp.]|nr:acyl-CoA thioesterase [Cypionkella sp.]
MYPYFRMFNEVLKFQSAPKLGPLDAHVSYHRIWPQDLDPWRELNNGRTLTLFDLGRIPMARRMGLDKVLAQNGWGLTVAGNSTRYRRRVTLFQRLRQVSRVIGWDTRFIYMEQSFWRDDPQGSECTAQMLLRSAIISKAGMVSPAKMIAAMGMDMPSPPLPDWAAAWIAADAQRPWPPNEGGNLR